MTEEIKFKIGERYENMKGVFEVVAIGRGSMDIRWEDGEQISTPIDLQQRIIERMRFEKQQAVVMAIQKEKKAKASASKKAKAFSGLGDSDFSSTISKTSWRGRGQLGGAVAKLLKNKAFTFNSWAVLRKPEVNWIDIQRQKQADLKFQTKFHARTADDHFFYGLLIPAPESSSAEKRDWHSLMGWLEKPENDTWLAKQVRSYDLSLRDLSGQGFTGALVVEGDQWVNRTQDQKKGSVVTLQPFLVNAGQSGALDLRIEKQIDKAAVIEKKQSIAGDLVSLFASLLPVYAASADR
jgi:hypothetical protein